MKKVLALLLAALLLLCTACSAAPAKIEETFWKYKDMESLTLAVTGEDLEYLLWSFGLEPSGEKDAAELVKAMKADSHFSTTFSDILLILHADGTAEYTRNGSKTACVWEYDGDAKESGYIAASEEDLKNEEARMKFTVSKEGNALRLETREPYDGDYQYTAVYVLQPSK